MTLRRHVSAKDVSMFLAWAYQLSESPGVGLALDPEDNAQHFLAYIDLTAHPNIDRMAHCDGIYELVHFLAY